MLTLEWKEQNIHPSGGKMEAKVITVPNKLLPIDLAGNLSLIPGLERSLGEGNGYPLQYFCLEHSMDRGGWWASVHGIAKSWTWLSDFTFTFMHWRRKWQPTPVFLPGESQGQGSLVGCCLGGPTELDTTEWLTFPLVTCIDLPTHSLIPSNTHFLIHSLACHV